MLDQLTDLLALVPNQAAHLVIERVGVVPDTAGPVGERLGVAGEDGALGGGGRFAVRVGWRGG